MEPITLAVIGAILGVAGFLFKLFVSRTNDRILTMEAKIDNIKDKMKYLVTDRDVRQLVDDKLDVIKVMLSEIKEDVKELKRDKHG